MYKDIGVIRSSTTAVIFVLFLFLMATLTGTT